MSESKLAPYARVIMVNPLHKDLPQMVLHLQPTCKCFDNNFVLHQWLLFDRLTETFLDPILGPDVGKASVGDSRRRKLHLSQSSDSSGGPRFKPISINDGFIFSARLDDQLVKDLSNQDFIHNNKKLDNNLDSTVRDIRMGLFPVHRNYIRLVAETFSKHVHGLRDEHINKGDRQNWGAAQRTCFPRVRKCLLSVTNGTAPVHDPMAL